jgi:hypothetical protein
VKRRIVRNRKTDYGTVILHLLLVSALCVAVLSGLRIATESPDRAWINVIDPLLPRSHVWRSHMQAAVVLIAVGIAYAIYLFRASLLRRIRFDRVRALGLIRRSRARWEAINVVLYWGFYATLVQQIVTGGMLYLGYGGSVADELHWIGMWIILGYVPLHVVTHWQIGGARQLMRIVRPAHLAPPPPPFDPAEMLAMLGDAPSAVAGGAAETPQRRGHAAPADRRTNGNDGRVWRNRSVLQANPFVVAIALSVSGISLLLLLERTTVDTLRVHRVSAAEVPVIDGETSDAIWRRIVPVHVLTGHGGNFDGKGETDVSIRAVHDGVWCYFLFIWDDPTRSLKQLPLVKVENGWQLLQDGHERGDEHSYNEDKFSVLLTKVDAVLAGDRTFHAGPEPASGKPRTLSGRGLHYSPDEYVDVWQWKATSNAAAGVLDDDHFGPPQTPTAEQAGGKVPYRGGFAPDPGASGYAHNFEPTAAGSHRDAMLPRRLPKDLAASLNAMGRIDLDPERGESEGARWYLTEAESVLYSAEFDAAIPIGTVIPGVIATGSPAGDRADVRCAARWAAGRWALEVARRLDTGSRYDTPISSGTFMRVAAFDHSQIRHTRHVRPIRLEVDR